MLLAISSHVMLRLRHGLGFGWGGAITFMLLEISIYVTLRLRHGLGFGWGVVGQ